MSHEEWEVEPTLPGVPIISRVLVCRCCGAILRRMVDNAPSRAVGCHADTCREAMPEYSRQPGLFA